jgi:alanine dehydrogenase
VRTLASTHYAIEEAALRADLVIGSVLVAGARAPKLVSDDLVSRMRPGSVLVDIAVDQGGCFEGSHPTTYDDPVFAHCGSTFYCVANMPGSVPVTSTSALTNATLPYLARLADGGLAAALRDPPLRAGISTVDGTLVNTAVGAAHDIEVEALPADAPV